MTLAQALQALIESDRWEQPEVVFRPDFLEALNRADLEELQHRSNQEWRDLIAEESDPEQGAALLLDWLDDRTQAWVKEEGYAERESAGERLRDD